MNIAILGRQPYIGLAELERIYGGKNVSRLSPESATFSGNSNFDIQGFGGIIKAGIIIDNLTSDSWQKITNQIIKYFISNFSDHQSKITLGISTYNIDVKPHEIQKLGLSIKGGLKKRNTSLRLIPNTDSALSTATSHHNKLGLSPNKIELLIVKSSSGKIIVASSTGSQNITAYANRDQARPKRDAFVGMLPPKLAQIMINLATGQLVDSNLHAVSDKNQYQRKAENNDETKKPLLPTTYGLQPTSSDLRPTILDPFCGTGVILQEAALMGYSVYGTDLSDKMIRYSRDNLNWLIDSHHIQFEWYLHVDDAMTAKWRQPISAVVCESYLGQPFSAPPSPAKLTEVTKNCNHIIIEFLKNIRDQIETNTPICIAVPAWRDSRGGFTHLPIVDNLARFGYKPHEFMNISQNDLLYYREDQIVAREILLITKI